MTTTITNQSQDYPTKPSRLELILPVARVYWACLFAPKPQGMDGEGEPKYAATFAVPKSVAARSQDWERFKAAMNHYGDRIFSSEQVNSKTFKPGVRDGDLTDKPYYKDCWIIKATSNGTFPAPPVYIPNPRAAEEGQPKMVEYPVAEQSKLGHGFLARGIVSAYAFQPKYAGFGFNLKAIAVLSDGEAYQQKDYAKTYEDVDLLPKEDLPAIVHGGESVSEPDDNPDSGMTNIRQL